METVVIVWNGRDDGRDRIKTIPITRLEKCLSYGWIKSEVNPSNEGRNNDAPIEVEKPVEVAPEKDPFILPKKQRGRPPKAK